MGGAEFEIPKGFAEKRRLSIHRVLDQLERARVLQLFGDGVDAGCFVGTSCGVLEQRGLNVVYVERDGRCISAIRDLGVRIVHDEVINYVSSIGVIDFITFFGAPASFQIAELVDVGRSKLSDGGSILVTGYDNIESQVNQALNIGGIKLRPQRVHDWDSLAYAYST